MLFFCPTLYAMGERGTINGYDTNYRPNGYLFGVPPTEREISRGEKGRWPLRKFSYLNYIDQIALVLETMGNHAIGAPFNIHDPHGCYFLHNDHTNLLFLSGAVKSIRKDSKVPVRFFDGDAPYHPNSGGHP